MKKKSLLSVLTAICSVESIHASSRVNPLLILDERLLASTRSILLTTYTYDLDPLIIISHNVNEKVKACFNRLQNSYAEIINHT